ncbi:hypothetical protein GCM10009555_017440 [Acrocarpospora macrocephala]|uniref:Head-to-tail stopper n=2 Tax=Acrocarpospora macrocephala TaxID=150177 RepID=A0A5M3WEK9_9ACTN|nr:hypothetical protein Amac_009990 [Acrocarpospora macrocephala]
MAGLPEIWLVHEVQVEPFAGAGAYGDTFGPAVTRAGFMEEKRRKIRDKNGAEVVSNSTFYTQLDHVADFPVGSRVAYAGRVSKVLTADRHDGAGLPLPSHLEVYLQ